MSFWGYTRSNGSVGTRNFVGVISTVTCANDVAQWITQQVPGCALFTHQQGCGQSGPDMEIVHRTLISLGCNPNLAGVLLVSLGCEGPADHIMEGIAASGKPVSKIVIQDLGGASAALTEGSRLARRMVTDASRMHPEEVDDSNLMIGVKCGASDTTSGLAANPSIGAACDILIEKGGSCIFGETPEMMGAEHILARRAASPEIGRKIIEIVDRMEKRALSMGVDMRGANPSRGNIAAGLTTIEEKSLGAIVKGGTTPIKGVCEHGERPEGKGLFILDGPGQEPKAVTALAAAGAQVILFATGIGAPQGFPFVPVIKVTANPLTYERLLEHLDIYIDIANSHKESGLAIFEETLSVASGKKTKAEALGYGNFPDIWVPGTTF
ncbi:MAG: UxaA family hydrolase [Deltaproteobacteria bacterium]|nr:UxaA family hydrolase [Deltaproteobacteria bacterium]